jgi:mannan endo-1,4-beta-mannosidase
MENFLKVIGSKLCDPCGKPILLRGVNKMFIFEQDPAKRIGSTTFKEIAKSGANCVRIVWGMGRINGQGKVEPSSVKELDAVISNCKAHNMIPIVGLWDYTGDQATQSGFKKLSEYTDFWVRQDVLEVLKKHQDALIINIANEAAPECDDSDGQLQEILPTYIRAYILAISKMRSVGINVPLMIDGLDFGKSLKCFSFIREGLTINTATELLKADKLNNLIFSFHSYWPKRFTDGQTFVEDIFNQAVKDGFCFVNAELCKYGAFADNESVCSDKGEVDYQRFAKLCAKNKVGYILWEWGLGNEFNNPLCVKMNMTTDGTFAGLKDWGKLMVNSKTFGFQVSGRFTNYLKSGFVKC